MIKRIFFCFFMLSKIVLLSAAEKYSLGLKTELIPTSVNCERLIKKQLPSWKLYNSEVDSDLICVTYSPEGGRDTDQKIVVRKIMASPESLSFFDSQMSAKHFKNNLESSVEGSTFKVLLSTVSEAFCEIHIPQELGQDYDTSILLMITKRDELVYYLEYWKKGKEEFSQKEKDISYKIFTSIRDFS